MVGGDAHEQINCPQCGQEHMQTRFDGKITCKTCGAVFKFSSISQKLLLAVIALVVIVCVISLATLYLVSHNMAFIIISVGAIAVFGLLIYQGKVPQTELITPNKAIKKDV